MFTMKLHVSPISPPCIAVQYFLEVLKREKGIEVEQVFVDLARGDHKKPPHSDMNPDGTVPFLETAPGEGFSGHVPILQYLAMTYASEFYGNGDPKQQAMINSRMDVANDMHNRGTIPGFSEIFWPKLGGLFGKTEPIPEQVNKAYKTVHSKLAILEQRLATSDHIAGGDLASIADYSLIGLLTTVESLGVDFTAYPKLDAYYQRHIASADFVACGGTQAQRLAGINPALAPEPESEVRTRLGIATGDAAATSPRAIEAALKEKDAAVPSEEPSV